MQIKATRWPKFLATQTLGSLPLNLVDLRDEIESKAT